MVKVWACAALALTASIASAGTVSFQSAYDFQSNQSIELPKFDPSQGMLNSVKLELSYVMPSITGDLSTGQIVDQLVGDIDVDLEALGTVTATAPNATLEAKAEFSLQFQLQPNSSLQVTIPSLQGTGDQETLSGTDIAPYIAALAGQTFSVQLSGVEDITTAPAGSSYDNRSRGPQFGGDFVVTYNFDNNVIPLPAAVWGGIVMTGAIALTRARRFICR